MSEKKDTYIDKDFELDIVNYNESEKVSVYSILYKGQKKNEFVKFLEAYQDVEAEQFEEDFQIILNGIDKIMKRGVLERYLRREGLSHDNVCGLPNNYDKKGPGLRLYGLRLSDKIIIIGNGDYKAPGVNKTQDCERLDTLIKDLQKIDKILRKRLHKTIIIDSSGKFLVGDLNFKITKPIKVKK